MRTTIAALAAPLLLLNADGVAEAQETKPPEPTTIIKCEEAATGGTAPLYDGKSASYMYDERFKPGPDLTTKELSDHTPQGVAWWKNWDGKGNDLLLVTTYGKGKAHIVGLDPKAGTRQWGPLTSSRGTTRSNRPTPVPSRERQVGIRRRTQIRRLAHDPQVQPDRSQEGDDGESDPSSLTGEDRKVYGASFMTIDGGHLYAGKFSKENRDWMYSYTITATDP